MKDNNEACGKVLIHLDAQTLKCVTDYDVQGSVEFHINVLAALVNAFHSVRKGPIESISDATGVPIEDVYMIIVKFAEKMKQVEDAKSDGAVDAGDFMESLLCQANGGKQ